MDAQKFLATTVFIIFYSILIAKGEKLIVSTLIQDPYLFNKAKSGNAPVYEGYIKDLLERLSKDVGFTYDFIFPDDGEYGRQNPNGTWTGMIDDIVSERAHMIAGSLTVTSKRADVVEFSYPFQITNVVMVLRRPDQARLPVIDRIKRIWSPFESSVWLLTIAAFFVTSSAIYVISYFNPYDWRRLARDGEATIRERESFTCMNSFWFALSALTLQGYIRSPRSLGARVVVTAWWMFVIVFVSCYISKLTGLLQIPPNEEEIEGYLKFQGLRDVINRNIKFMVIRGGAVDDLLRYNTQQEYIQRLGAELKSGGSGEYVANLEEGIKKLENYPSGKKAYITESLMVKYQTQRYGCQFYFVNEKTVKRQYSLGFPINSTYTNLMGRYILQYHEEGYLDYLEKKWFTGSCNQYVFEGTDEKYKIQEFYPLDTASFSGVLIVVAAGILIGVLVTIVECIIFKWAESGDPMHREHEPQKESNPDGMQTTSSLLGQQNDRTDTQV
ncbi:glutamate receptor ionotropic, kainate 1-like [Mytilus californianus]|uniref:glutamate receptor ionotropic, kainate 1-like n=1 Tax=Mytilus californianus TaxID=6549 RepID=UPI002245B6A6|nr:glutamate receptor ionotropic, kainate 1-like [Mytilus californianus]